MNSEKHILDVLSYAKEIAEDSSNQDLLPEVIVWSLKHMKENPFLSIEEALEAGYREWVK